MKALATALFAAILSLAAPVAPVSADPVVIELFTSQGCSSCPPADRLLGRLAKRDDLLALSLHVDYWDYIGWKDEFALPRCARRQRGYARAAGRDMIYTPQMIVNGREALTGTRPMELAELIMKYQRPGHDEGPVDLALTRRGNRLTVALRPRAAKGGGAAGRGGSGGGRAGGDLVVQLVQYAPHLRSDIARGENAGRRLDYYNVVRDWRVLGEWDGAAPARFEARLRAGLSAAVIVQRAGYGPILAAARAE